MSGVTPIYLAERVDESNINALTTTSKCRLTTTEDGWVVLRGKCVNLQHFVTERVERSDFLVVLTKHVRKTSHTIGLPDLKLLCA